MSRSDHSYTVSLNMEDWNGCDVTVNRFGTLFAFLQRIISGSPIHQNDIVTQRKDDNPSSRDILWQITRDCAVLPEVNSSSLEDYCHQCSFPRTDSACNITTSLNSTNKCFKTLAVFDETSDFFAIRDRKMCTCEPQFQTIEPDSIPEFIHTLVIPFEKVLGLEEKELVPSILWNYSFALANRLIPEKQEIGLLVNSVIARSQDQFHLHILRVDEFLITEVITQKFILNPKFKFNSFIIQNFEYIWEEIDSVLLEDPEYSIYSVLAVPLKDSTFLVIVSPDDLEHLLTKYKCSRSQ